jgi:hypothetical protein
MKTLIETTLVTMFTAYLNRKNLTPGELPAAYDEFVSLLSEFSNDDRIRHLRRLNYTKIELSFLKQMSDGMTDGRHVLYDVFINKSLTLLETEIRLIKDLFMDKHAPSTFQVENLPECRDGKKLISLTWNGTDSDLIELVAALIAAGAIGTTEGKKVNVVDVIHVFEEAFHLKINALYSKRGKVFDRCTNTTPFIDSLRNSYNRMLEKRLA